MDHGYSKKESDEQHSQLHSAISAEIQGVQSSMNAQIGTLATKKDLDDFRKSLEPITDGYKAFLFSKSFVSGLAGIVLGISAIGAGFIWLINHAVGK